MGLPIRAIYTSPIKALSNQKFRDFKQTFGSNTVGILTGDVQINPEANCLIMTTEILRSMLYKGADLIRDVEFVIFDEVHYVNDAEVRGPPLPSPTIVFLFYSPEHMLAARSGLGGSDNNATRSRQHNLAVSHGTKYQRVRRLGRVSDLRRLSTGRLLMLEPSRTKRKDIYVISTAKRPVPLEHYLYAGKELWKIADASHTFLAQGYTNPLSILGIGRVLKVSVWSYVFPRYKDAGEALRRKQDKEREAAGLPPLQRLGARAAAPQRGARGLPTGRGGPSARGRGQVTRAAAPSRGGSPSRFNYDKTLYVHLMGNLKKKSLLPVVVFTLSKKRCEENASTLTNLDLCTSTEKSEVHVAIEKALGRLKGVYLVERVLHALGFSEIDWDPGLSIAPSMLFVLLAVGLVLTWFLTHDPRFGQGPTTDKAYERPVIKRDWSSSRRFAPASQRGLGPHHQRQSPTPTPSRHSR